MSQTEIITELTPEQEALIPVYLEKWRAMAIADCFASVLSTEPIDRQKAKEAVKTAYTLFEVEDTEILLNCGTYRLSPFRLKCDRTGHTQVASFRLWHN
jgi:hypothetical protein